MTTPTSDANARMANWRLQGMISGDDPIVVPQNDNAGSPPLVTEPNVPQQQWDRMEATLNDVAANVDPVALAQALAMQPGFIDAIADAVIDRMSAPLTADEVARATVALLGKEIVD